ncbi:MAG: hypothetical protein BA863_03500 [Desulfovibrio sp. S3730MH75]|nr:MAG: hypothetical protein BA863_03500 [Desulfovibrio sp. S3730MH75]
MNISSIEEIAEQIRALIEDQHKLDKEDAICAVSLAIDKMTSEKDLVTVFALIPKYVADSLMQNGVLSSESATRKGVN